jgi:hypothetical protein
VDIEVLVLGYGDFECAAVVVRVHGARVHHLQHNTTQHNDECK